MEETNIPTLNEARNYINTIDFSKIIEKTTATLKWKKKDVVEICDLYKRFLLLRKKTSFDIALVPSQEIDEIWHNHILDTKKYREDCKNIFGFYLDHNPYDSNNTLGSSDTNAFTKTQELYCKEYGNPIPEVRMNTLKLIKNIISNLFTKSN